MKHLYILFLLLIPFLGFGQSNDKMMHQAEAAPAATASYSPANKDVEMAAETFTAPVVNQPQVGSFQKRGIQKLKDFYNYLTIISNPKLDKTLRENAKIQAKQLFYGTDCKIDGKNTSDFIDSCGNLLTGVEWRVVNVTVKENLTPNTNDSTASIYRGALAFNESANAVLSGVKKAEIVLSKSEKQFGNKKKEVWEVFICTIE